MLVDPKLPLYDLFVPLVFGVADLLDYWDPIFLNCDQNALKFECVRCSSFELRLGTGSGHLRFTVVV